MSQEKSVKYKFLDWLRCIGVCLIVYDHLGPLRNSEWFVSRLVDAFVNKPLGIIQYFGAFGVCLFFIISGFCLTTSPPRGWQFIYNKIIRIMVPVFGILIRAVYDGRLSIPAFLSTFAVSYLIFLKNIMVFRPYYYSDEPYLISLAYAILIFGLFLLLEEKMAVPRFVKFISNISFSLYLIHMTMGGFFMSALGVKFGFTVSFFVTVIVVTLLAWCHYEWIEKKVAATLKLRR